MISKVMGLLSFKAMSFLRSREGNVESALTIIPILTLFLIGMQLALTSHLRNMERVEIQAGVSARAISGNFLDGDEFIHIDSSGDGQNLDLLVAHQSHDIPHLVPGISGLIQRQLATEVDGLAIIENQR